ncbi:hypothetical protein C0J52_02367 [Blattella germanica]|nr:hypothetical protein C0J52_02367 [Blattella germanica]
MAANVPKPRRTRGTVAFRTSNYFALGVIGVGVLCGVLLHLTPGAQKIKEQIKSGAWAVTEDQINKSELMDVVPRKRGPTLQKMMEEAKEQESH